MYLCRRYQFGSQVFTSTYRVALRRIIQECELNKDPDNETGHWGSFYLHPEEVAPGFYDFVFIYGNKVFATMLTRFYKPDELLGKPDSDLEELMSQKPF